MEKMGIERGDVEERVGEGKSGGVGEEGVGGRADRGERGEEKGMR